MKNNTNIQNDSTGKGKPYVAKGSNVSRCEGCMMATKFCICSFKKSVSLDTGYPVEIWLLMHKEESYKPSNTGRLIEHIIPNSSRRFYWHRTNPDSEFIELLKNERYQPYIIFPGDRGGYEERLVSSALLGEESGAEKIPAFIILDGSWRQAGRMFRLSKYLQHLPVLPLDTKQHSQYKLRKAPDEFHLCTVEVAIELLLQHRNEGAANDLRDYFSVFNDMYAQSRRETPAKSD